MKLIKTEYKKISFITITEFMYHSDFIDIFTGHGTYVFKFRSNIDDVKLYQKVYKLICKFSKLLIETDIFNRESFISELEIIDGVFIFKNKDNSVI